MVTVIMVTVVMVTVVMVTVVIVTVIAPLTWFDIFVRVCTPKIDTAEQILKVFLNF